MLFTYILIYGSGKQMYYSTDRQCFSTSQTREREVQDMGSAVPQPLSALPNLRLE